MLGVLLRLVAALACLVATAVIVFAMRGGYSDTRHPAGTVTSWLDAFYYAVTSMSSFGSGGIQPETESARLVNILVVVPLRFLFVVLVIGTSIQVLTESGRQYFRYLWWRRRVKKHTVIIGFGTKGRAAARALIEQGTPAERIVIVDNEIQAIKAATAAGFVGIQGDARREEVLRQASVPSAQRVIVAADRDDTNVLVTLTTRRLAENATIAAAVREEQNIGVLRQGGADVIIPTAESAGRLLGLSLAAPNAGQVIEDLLEPVAGLQISERTVRPEEVGLTPARLTAQGEIVLTVVRNGVSHRFDSGTVRVFQPGDVIVVITGPTGLTKSPSRVRS